MTSSWLTAPANVAFDLLFYRNQVLFRAGKVGRGDRTLLSL
jgi:hypothetical protein